jgi:CheY-like chemotaxis protein
LPDDIVLDMVAPATDLAVHVDSSEFERALFNLVLNARDAMPRGGCLRVACDRKVIAADDVGLLPGCYATLRVTDTGEGIAPETLEHIFEPFFTTKPVGMGTGLGLATVYAFAKEAGGALRVESSVGAGSTFTLLLPEAADRASATVAPGPSPAAEGMLAALGGRTRILVVEDNPIVRENMVQILRREGHEVSEAADGDRAMAMLAEKIDFSVLCIDGVMPGASTHDVIEKAESQCPSLRVLLCSGHLREELLRRGVAAGRYAFLPKPFSAQDLVSAVRGLAVSSG